MVDRRSPLSATQRNAIARGFAIAHDLQTASDGGQYAYCRVHDLQRLLGLVVSERVFRALIGELYQPLSFIGENHVALLDGEFDDVPHRAILPEIGHFFLHRDQVLIAGELVGNLEKFADGRIDAACVPSCNIWALCGRDEILHQIRKARLQALGLTEIAFGENTSP